MNLRLVLPAAAILAGLVSCGPEKAPVTQAGPTTATSNAPAWIDHEEIPDGLAAVGIAQANVMGDKSMQRTVALADARTKMAGKLKVKVQNLFTQLNQQVATAAATEPGKKPVRTEVMNRVVENTTRQLIDQELAGTTARAWYTDPADGNLYVFLVMTKDSMDTAMRNVAQSQIKKEIAQGEVALDAALDKLDAAIAAVK
jgi:hypothetical protein